MKSLLLNGFNKEDYEIDALYNTIMKELENKDWEIESIILRDVNIAPCQGCFECWVKTPGECKIDDYGRDVTRKMVQSDLIIHFTPITFGGYSSELKKVLDRFIPNVLPFFTKIDGETHHTHRYKNRASIIVIGILNQPDSDKETVFKTLIQRNSLNMRAPIHETLIYIKQENNGKFLSNFNKILKKVGGSALESL